MSGNRGERTLSDGSMTTTKLTVGQKLWYVPGDGRSALYLQVLRVGRKWATVERIGRVSVETLQSEWGMCYLSPDDCEQHRVADDAWLMLLRGSYRRRPRHITTDDIKRAAEILGLGEVVE